MGYRSEPVSIIEKGFVIEGFVSWKGMLIISGTVKGTLVGETIVIAEEGSVYAKAKVAKMSVGGVFNGEAIASSEFFLLSTGNCAGKIACKDLVVEAGGILNAEVRNIIHRPPESDQDGKPGEPVGS